MNTYILTTEPMYESWYQSTLKPKLENVLGPGKSRISKRTLKGHVRVEIRCADEAEPRGWRATEGGAS